MGWNTISRKTGYACSGKTGGSAGGFAFMMEIEVVAAVK
jgi:hypothetical protein